MVPIIPITQFFFKFSMLYKEKLSAGSWIYTEFCSGVSWAEHKGNLDRRDAGAPYVWIASPSLKICFLKNTDTAP